MFMEKWVFEFKDMLKLLSINFWQFWTIVVQTQRSNSIFFFQKFSSRRGVLVEPLLERIRRVVVEKKISKTQMKVTIAPFFIFKRSRIRSKEMINALKSQCWAMEIVAQLKAYM